jgi:hypothetical protein
MQKQFVVSLMWLTHKLKHLLKKAKIVCFCLLWPARLGLGAVAVILV